MVIWLTCNQDCHKFKSFVLNVLFVIFLSIANRGFIPPYSTYEASAEYYEKEQSARQIIENWTHRFFTSSSVELSARVVKVEWLKLFWLYANSLDILLIFRVKIAVISYFSVPQTWEMREHFLRRFCSLHMNQLIGELSINFSNHSIQYIYLHFRIQSDSSLEHAFCVKLQTRKKTRWFTYNPLRREMCKLLTVQMHAYSLRFFYPSSNIRRYYYSVDSVCWGYMVIMMMCLFGKQSIQLSNTHTRCWIKKYNVSVSWHVWCVLLVFWPNYVVRSGVKERDERTAAATGWILNF